ncbi:MAG: hypothetical protein ACJ8FY_17135 [Gemmataceae bacterium]
MLILSLCASGFLLLFALSSVYGSARYKEANISSALIGMLGCGALSSPLLMANALLIVLSGLICQACSARFRTYLGACLAATVTVYLVAGIYALSSVKKRADLAAQFPFESMHERLAYEGAHQVNSESNMQEPATPARENDKNLKRGQWLEMEERIDCDYMIRRRAYSLKEIHSDSVKQFINSPGFGVVRGMRPSETVLEIEEPAPVPLSDYDYKDILAADFAVADSGDKGQNGVGSKELEESSLRDLHTNGLFDFINPRGFGYIERRDRVAGFQAHRFSRMPKLDAPLRWEVQDLELVSLLKHEEPVAYISKNLPRMDELRDAKTRPLDAFERDALQVLKHGEDLKVRHAPREIRMVGSIRAVSQCVQCHEVERGDLLGAFSYRLRPE